MRESFSDVMQGSQTKECRWPLKAEQGKEKGSPLKAPEGTSPANALN